MCGLLLAAASANAQYVRLMTSGDQHPSSVKVILTPSAKGAADIVIVTDADGKAKLPAAGYPYRIAVHDMSYENVHDTIGGPYDKVIWLDAKTMSPVVITGQYQATSADNAVQRVEVIDRKKIDAMAAQNLRDVLTNQLEVRLEYDAIFGSSMNMQGSRRYGADAKILIDGVPVVGKQDGAIDLSQVNLANIERIEIIKGPMSVSYGTDAIAGTVNLITKKTVKNKVEAQAGTYYETPGTYNVNVGGGFHRKAHSLRVDGFRNFFGGWKPGNGASFFDFSDRPADTSRAMLWKPREQYQGALQYIYTHGKTSVNYKGSYFYEVITDRGMPMQPYYEMAIDRRYHTYRRDNAVFLNTDVAGGKHINVFAAYNAYKRVKTEGVNDLTTLTENRDPALQDISYYNEFNSRGVLTSGNSNKKLDYEVGYDVNIQFANSTQIVDRRQQMGNYALYGSAEYRPFSQLTVRPGLRYGYNTRYDAPLIPSVNLMYKPDSRLAFRASYAKGFRQPDLKDLYFELVDINHDIHGNPDLKAEYSDNYLASVSYNGRTNDVAYRTSISAYYNRVNDLITLVQKVGGGPTEYWYQNISFFVTKGLQATADVSVGAFAISVGGSYLGTYNQLSETEDLPEFSYSPEARSSITYTNKQYGFSVSAFYKYTGRAIRYVWNDDADMAVQARMNDYTIADLTMSKQFFKKRLNISAGCKNLFDVANVAATQGGGGGVHAATTSSAAISMGRYYFVGTQYNFSK
ncbi:TonB-dependent receptor [Nemorincola caseinilytica]|uniref:TonB-dependent receptor n=1 Tax=Nemorincola caseinilytica TaxID=2054315 RepID=A0ABP8N6F9_9BACT